MELSPTAYVILGMLSFGPKSGYEIKGLVDKSTRFFWAASYGQIYPELKRLAAAGLVTGADASQGGRRRTVYELTDEGPPGAARLARVPARDLRDAPRGDAEALLRRRAGSARAGAAGP